MTTKNLLFQIVVKYLKEKKKHNVLFFHCRYYFKMACEDFDAGVIMDEVSDDNAILPLWEGKVVGKVKKIE